MDLTSALVSEFGNERIVLLPERAVLHTASKTLYLADLHIGKSATFRAASIPIPEGDTFQDLERLETLVRGSGVTRVVILGDFLHAAPGRLDPHWRAWRSGHPDLEVLIVRGNHDTTAGDPPADWDVRLVDEPFDDGVFLLRHHPEAEDGPTLAGHEHPAVRLRGSSRDSLSLPCFHMRDRLLVLPAFTSFSGGYPVTPSAGDRVFAIADHSVLDVTRMLR